jgi:hypothetical protein
MPPFATLCQSALDAAVGRSVKARKVAGSTPSMATYFPLTWTRAASTSPAAVTSCTRRTAASLAAGSEVSETTRTSAVSSLPSGARLAVCGPLGGGDADAMGAGSIRPAEMSRSEAPAARPVSG